MKLALLRKYWILLVIPLVGLAVVIFLFDHFSQNDYKAISDFSTAYNNYDKAISDFSTAIASPNQSDSAAADGLEQRARTALFKMKQKASVRISSLTKHDAELMVLSLEIGDLSQKEFETVREYKNEAAGKNSDLARLAKALTDLASQRQTAYSRFRDLLGLKD